MKVSHLSVAVLAATLASPAMSEKQSDFEVYLGAAQTFWDSDRDLDDSTSLELGAELPIDEALSFEAWINDYEADTDIGGVELDGNRYTLGGLYHLRAGSYRPFLSAGVGHQEFSASGLDADETLLYVGAGAKKYFDNNLILRGELLAMNSLDEEMTDLALRVAVGYAFGGAGAVSEQAYQEPVAAEAPAQTPAEETKPAEPAPVEQAAAPAPVEKAPAPVDSDKDGVVDAQDQCPDTDPAFKVDEKGCAETLEETISVELHVKFKTNSAEFTDDKGEVKELGAFLNKYDHTQLVVEGHTDSQGSASYNKRLSQQRADAVKAALVNTYGIDASRIEAIGYGEEQPIASNDTADGRAQNRRVIGKLSDEDVTKTP